MLQTAPLSYSGIRWYEGGISLCDHVIFLWKGNEPRWIYV